ncbi:MAG: ABC transporter ATP-binding protein [Opitutales bacterium]|nr:ABC transporter ATP-binding protein [Opitutales bacterium]
MNLSKLTQFAHFYLKSSGCKFYLLQVLEVLNSSAKGVGMLLILPLLSVSGYLMEAPSNGIVYWITSSLNRMDIEVGLFTILILYFGLNILLALSTYYQSTTEAILHQNFLQKIRSNIFDKIVHCEWKYLVTRKQSDITFTSTTDIQQVHLAGIQFLRSIKSIIQLVVGLVVCACISAKLTLLAFFTGSIYFLSQALFYRKTIQNAAFNRDAYNLLFGEVMESLGSLKLIKSHAFEGIKSKEFSQKAKDLGLQLVIRQKLTNQQKLLQTIIITMLIVVYTWIALTYLNVAGTILALFILLLYRVSNVISSLTTQITLLLGTLPSFDSYCHQIGEMDKHIASYATQTDQVIDLENEIVLKNVSFSYSNEDEQRLKNISLRIKVNQTTAIIGSSGAGKTTLVDTLLGLLSPTSGQLLVDGREITPSLVKAWQNTIAYVPQESFLRHDTILNNLREFAPKASLEDVKRCLQIAQAYTFVSDLPEGLNTVVGDRGVRLSGGERQRIVLARALLRKPKLLILDEATSNLDGRTEKAIQDAIEELHGHLTIVIVAHRLTSIENADCTVILENGQLKSPYHMV